MEQQQKSHLLGDNSVAELVVLNCGPQKKDIRRNIMAVSQIALQ